LLKEFFLAFILSTYKNAGADIQKLAGLVAIGHIGTLYWDKILESM